MARPLRIEYEGAYYHVLSRGNHQQAVFLSDEDRNTFLYTIGRMSERYDVDIFAFVLMDNHYHLLLRTNQANLSKSMQWLGTTYTTIFNLSHSKKGHLFQGRFKSILVEDEPYLLQLSYYIHANPLRAGIVKRLIDYHWSSYPAYATNKQHPDWLKTDLILARFGSEHTRCKAYREKMQQYAEEKKNIWEEVSHGVLYGSQEFVDRIKKAYLSEEQAVGTPLRKSLDTDVGPAEFVEASSAILQIDMHKIKNARRIARSDMRNRDMLVYHMWQSGRFSNSQIGEQVGLGVSAVSRRVGVFQIQLQQDAKLRWEYEKFRSILKM